MRLMTKLSYMLDKLSDDLTIEENSYDKVPLLSRVCFHPHDAENLVISADSKDPCKYHVHETKYYTSLMKAIGKLIKYPSDQ